MISAILFPLVFNNYLLIVVVSFTFDEFKAATFTMHFDKSPGFGQLNPAFFSSILGHVG